MLYVNSTKQPYKHILQSHCSYWIICHRTDTEFCTTSRTNTSILNIEIGNLRQEFLHLEFISPLLHYRIADVTEVTFFRLYILGSNVGSGTHSILILVELSLAVGLKNIDRRISVSISPNGEPLVCPGPNSVNSPFQQIREGNSIY